MELFSHRSQGARTTGLTSHLYRLTIYYGVLLVASRYNRGMKKLTLSDYQALAEFRYQIRRFLHFSEQVVKRAGLERGHLN